VAAEALADRLSWTDWSTKIVEGELRQEAHRARELAERSGVDCCRTCTKDEECEAFHEARRRVREEARGKLPTIKDH
jgi:hypothetical protein